MSRGQEPPGEPSAAGLLRAAGASDGVDDRVPAFVAAARTAEDVSAVLVEAAARGWAVVARGGGTKLEWGAAPTSLDAVVDLSQMNAVVEHAAGDLIVRVQAGVRLGDLQKVLAPAGQQLAVDEVVTGSTIGGLIATGLSGPRRHLFGAVRDLLLGVAVVRADGVSAKAGSRVVKNVAGYDLAKLYTGSYGTLAVVTEAIFRLHPVPEAARWVSAAYDSHAAVAAPLGAVLGSQLVPSAVEIDRSLAGGPMTVCVLVEGSAAGVEHRAEAVASLLGPGALVDAAAPPWWSRLPGPVTLKLAVPIPAVPEALATVGHLAQRAGLQPVVRGSAGLGIVHVGLGGNGDPGATGGQPDGDACAALLEGLRSWSAGAGGSVIVLAAPAACKAGLDVWGPVPGLSLMRRVKHNFDPAGILAPGRFVGGI